MRLVYEFGIINIDKILEETGEILFRVQDYSRVSRTLYDIINDDNQYKLAIITKQAKSLFKGEESTIIYETSTKENVEGMKKKILDAYIQGKGIFIIKENM